MPNGRLTTVVDYLRRLAPPPRVGDLADALLLERFAQDRDEGSFALLLQRHGRLVWGVCRDILRNSQDAEDAFQATFLVLASRAGAIRKGASVRSWLYGVSYRIAMRSRKALARRERIEGRELEPVVAVARPVHAEGHDDELQLLHAEIERLPPKYRLPVILHYLEGKSREETAQQLGWTEGAVKGRLERARTQLRARLLRRGLTLAAGPVAALFAANRAISAAPTELVLATARIAKLYVTETALPLGASTASVVALVNGTLRSMMVTKMKSALGWFVALSVFGVGVGSIGYRVLATPSAEAEAELHVIADEPRPPASRDVQLASYRDGIVVLIGTEITNEAEEKSLPEDRLVRVKIGGETKVYRKLIIGDSVEAGQLVALIDDRVARAEYAVRESQVRTAEAELTSAKATYEEAKAQYETGKRLYQQNARAMSNEELSTRQRTTSKYLAEFTAKQAGLETARLQLKQARTLVELHEIRSSVAGKISEIYRLPGEGGKALEPVMAIRPTGK